MTAIEPLDLDNLRAYARAALERAEKATPGLWDYDPDMEDITAVHLIGVGPYWVAQQASNVDGPFIAHSRLDVPNLAASVLTLCAEVEQAWAENTANMLDIALLSAALDPLRAMPQGEA